MEYDERYWKRLILSWLFIRILQTENRNGMEWDYGREGRERQELGLEQLKEVYKSVKAEGDETEAVLRLRGDGTGSVELCKKQ